MNDYDELLDLDAEGLDVVSVEWLPMEILPGLMPGMPGGGYYVMEFKFGNSKQTIFASPSQVELIQEAINEGTDGNPPRQEFLNWIESYWDVVITTTSQGKSEDEDERCCEENALKEALDDWELLRHTEDGQDPLPAEVCHTLGIPEGSTDAAATTFIKAAIDKAWSWYADQ